MLRSVHSLTGVLQSLRSGFRVGTYKGRLFTPLPGRLAGRCGVERSSATTSGPTPSVLHGFGDRRQLREVGPPAIYLSSVSGDADRHVSREGIPVTSTSCSFLGGGDVLFAVSGAPSTNVAAAAHPWHH